MGRAEERKKIAKICFICFLVLCAGLFWAYSNTSHMGFASSPPMDFYIDKLREWIEYFLNLIIQYKQRFLT